MLQITMDPGDNTSASLWNKGKYNYSDFWKLSMREKKYTVANRHALLISYFESYLKRLKKLLSIEELRGISFVIEGVSLWGNSTKSQASALRGDSFRLAYLVGGYITAFQNAFPNCEVEIVDVRKWKGSLPTPVLEKEVERFIGEKAPNEHTACSIGIGMWKNGAL